jgi:hypothetical protein
MMLLAELLAENVALEARLKDLEQIAERFAEVASASEGHPRTRWAWKFDILNDYKAWKERK